MAGSRPARTRRAGRPVRRSPHLRPLPPPRRGLVSSALARLAGGVAGVARRLLLGRQRQGAGLLLGVEDDCTLALFGLGPGGIRRLLGFARGLGAGLGGLRLGAGLGFGGQAGGFRLAGGLALGDAGVARLGDRLLL